MSQGVTVVVNWVVKPGLADAFVETLTGLFPETRRCRGFRSIRLLAGATASDQFVLTQEWDDAQSFQDYARFRAGTAEAEKSLAMVAVLPPSGLWATDPLASAEA